MVDFLFVQSSDYSEEGSGGGLHMASPHYVGAMPHVHHPTSYASATQAADCRGRDGKTPTLPQ